MTKTRAVLFGCGPVGLGVVRYASQRQEIELVGAIDIDESLAGRDLGEVAGIDNKVGVEISADTDAVLSQTKPDVVFLTTVSSLKAVFPQLKKCLTAGVNVVSTCEELAYPFRADPQLSAEIDKIAKANNVTVLSTGVNPGFLMDSWSLFMTGVCQQVKRVKAVRVQNASSRVEMRNPELPIDGSGERHDWNRWGMQQHYRSALWLHILQIKDEKRWHYLRT